MSHNHNYNSEQWLSLAFWLNLIFSIVELIGGIVTNSSAIIADAFHDFLDAITIGWVVILEKYSHKKRTNHYTYGYRRFSLLSAIVMSVILMVGAVLMIVSAIKSLMDPKVVHSAGMFWLAVLGIVVNVFAFLRIKQGWNHVGHYHGLSNNSKAVMLHLLEDVLGWVAVLVWSALMYFTDWYRIDSVLTIGIACYILTNAAQNLKNTADIFLQSTPENVSVDQLIQQLKVLTLVRDVHDVHVWSLDGSYTIASLHIVVEKNLTKDQRNGIMDIMKNNNIQHPTIQIEYADGSCYGKER